MRTVARPAPCAAAFFTGLIQVLGNGDMESGTIVRNSMKIPLDHIGFDVDGVVADTMTLFLSLARNRLRMYHWRYEDITSYDLAECLNVDAGVLDPVLGPILDEPHRLDLQPMVGAVEALTRWSRCAPLCFVTARSDCASIYSWFLQTFKEVDPLTITLEATGSAEAKPAVLRELEIRFFVEDRLDTCFLLADQGITPIVYEQPWNRREHPFLKVRNWEELGALLE